MAGDSFRTGWYPNQPTLDPIAVGSGSFRQVFDTLVDGQVYAQPLVAKGVLLIATETNWTYGLDSVSGDILWSRIWTSLGGRATWTAGISPPR